MRAYLCVTLSALCTTRPALASGKQYSVTVISHPSTPVISWLNGDSDWPQNFNPSYVAASEGTQNVGGLLIRSQNCTPTPFVPGACINCNVDSQWPIAPYFPGSVLTFAKERPDAPGQFERPYLVFAPNASAPQDEKNGVEDPRLAYSAADGLYHLFYTCYGAPGPYLCHATTTNPTVPWPNGVWERHGAVFPKQPGSKSGALLIRESAPHYLIWGAGVIALAMSDDLMNFTTVNSSFITKRPSPFFDNNLVESGPPPMMLSDGSYLFLHNSDNTTGTGDFWAYNPGWVVLDGDDPSSILQRSSEPLLSPVNGWEQGTAPYMCNVHNVTFLEAARPVPGQVDTFDVWFGGSDAVIGTARIQVVIT